MRESDSMVKKISIMILTILILCMFIACQSKEDDIPNQVDEGTPAWQRLAQEPITFDWYINYSWYTTPWGQNAVSKAITAETGVSIKFIVPTGNESQKLDAMIASDILPDFITLGWWEEQAQTMINKDMVYALNILADQYDPYFYQVTNEQVINWYTKEDGNIYAYPNSAYTPEDFKSGINIGSNQNFLVRKDIYEAIGSPDMTTIEGFKNAVIEAHKMFPYVNGEPLIPIGSDEFYDEGCNSFDKYLQNFLAVPFEIDGKYNHRYIDEDYLNWLKMFRELNEMGYLSKEIFVDKRVQLEEKLAKGRYFCLLYQGSDIQASQKILNAKNPESIYIAVDGPKNSKGDDPTLPSAGINGWTLTFISKNCKDPERAIAFLSYLISEEGQKKVFLGVEGVTYDYVDGKYVIKPHVLELLNTNRYEYDRLYGADDAYWMLQNNVMQDQWLEIRDPLTHSLWEWTKPYTVYTSQYDIVFEADSSFAQIDKKIKLEWGKTLPLLLLAKSEEEFDEIFKNYKDKIYALGFEQLMEEYTRLMQDSKRKLGLE
ncbi:extracellular solute-binding protein [Herbinix luporum]|nr:extracellular solute-binding protein [Herbinix luporum]